MAHEVFLSYAQPDRNVADAVCARLESRGIRCWYAPRNILPGSQWSASIVDAIAGARIMVLVFSSHSNGSPHVRNELERAVGKNLPILPFRIEEVPPSKDIELFVSSPHWLDAITPPIERHIEQLAETIQVVLDHQAGVERPERPPPPSPKPPPRKSARGALVALVLLLLAGAGIAAFFLGRGPSAEEVARAFVEVDRLHRETRGLLQADHEAIAKCLHAAEAARERARVHEERDERKLAAELLDGAREGYRRALVLDRLAGLAVERRKAAEKAAGAEAWAEHPAVAVLLKAARQLQSDADAAFARAEFEAARGGSESAAAEFARAATVNAQARGAAGARVAFDAAMAPPPRSSLKPVADRFAGLQADAATARARFDAGAFAESRGLWERGLGAIQELRQLEEQAMPLEALLGTVREALAAPGRGFYTKLLPEVGKLGAALVPVEALLEKAENWGEVRRGLEAVQGRLATLRKAHEEAAEAARKSLASLAPAPLMAKRFPKEAEREAAMLAQAQKEYEQGDFDEVAPLVEQARAVRGELERLDAAERGKAEVLLRVGEKSAATIPRPLYRALAARSDAVAARLREARDALERGDYARMAEDLEVVAGEVAAIGREHAAAQGRARDALAAWKEFAGQLPAAVRVSEAAEKNVSDAEAAMAAADFDRAVKLCEAARGAVEGALAEWERTRELAAGSEWRGEIRRTSDGKFLAKLTLQIKTRDGEAITGWITVPEFKVNQSFSGTLKGTQFDWRLVRNARGEHAGSLKGELSGRALRGTYGVGGGNMSFEGTRVG
ncbi:MAG: TIR domain-containing protein [Planctomycetaceae bacterium]